MTIWEEITAIPSIRKKAYFMWKNGIANVNIDYGAMTEDEFIEYCSKYHPKPITNKEYFLKVMKKWESTTQYKRLIFLLKEDKFAIDILDVYDKVKDLAENGDSQAIKNMLLLQKEIKQYRQSIDKFQELKEEQEEEDDGLII